MTQRLLARRFDDRERAAARKAYQDFLRFYDSKPQEATRLIAQGESKPDASLPPAELAAATLLANQLIESRRGPNQMTKPPLRRASFSLRGTSVPLGRGKAALRFFLFPSRALVGEHHVHRTTPSTKSPAKPSSPKPAGSFSPKAP